MPTKTYCRSDSREVLTTLMSLSLSSWHVVCSWQQCEYTKTVVFGIHTSHHIIGSIPIHITPRRSLGHIDHRSTPCMDTIAFRFYAPSFCIESRVLSFGTYSFTPFRLVSSSV